MKTSTTTNAPSMRTVWMHAVGVSDLPRNAKLVAWAIGAHMNANGEAFPSRARLQQYSGLARTTTDRMIKEHLEPGGLLTIRRSKGYRPNVYQAAIPVQLWTRLDGEQVRQRTRTGPAADKYPSSTRPRSRSTEVHIEGASRGLQEWKPDTHGRCPGCSIFPDDPDGHRQGCDHFGGWIGSAVARVRSVVESNEEVLREREAAS